MTRSELERLEQKVLKAVYEARKLGGYDANAGPILFLTECVALIVQHLNKKPAKKKSKKGK